MAAPMSLTRPMLRSPVLRQLAARRLQSTAAEKASTTAEKAAAAAKDTANKAAQGLSRVTSAAGPAIAGAAKSIGKLGGPAGQAIAFLERTSRPYTHAQMRSEQFRIAPRGLEDRIIATPGPLLENLNGS